MARTCNVLELGVLSYPKGLSLQEKWVNSVEERDISGIFLLMQHSNVITIGRSGVKGDMLIPKDDFLQRGIEVFETNRGGAITYHGPGQLIGYPIINLRDWRKDVHWYVRSIEQVLINTLKEYGVTAGRKSAYTGVWVGDKKIAAIGVRIKNWITMHGFGLQIETENLHNFNLINPCGITEFGVMALEESVPTVNLSHVTERIKANFSEVFDCELQGIDGSKITGGD